MAGSKGEKFWADAVRRAVFRRMEDIEGKPQKIERLADKLVDAGMAGDIAALKEIGDRLDGRPAQALSVGSDPDQPLITRIERVIVDPRDNASNQDS